jgi:hypothetical protein
LQATERKYDNLWKAIKGNFFGLSKMGMGWKYFRHCSRTLGDLLVVDSILFYPMLFFIVLAILFLFDI